MPASPPEEKHVPLTRRDFVRSSAVLAAAGLGEGVAAMPLEAEPVRLAGGPILIGSANAVRTCTKAAELIAAGSHPLDAVVTGINIVEDDPSDHSVGYGGLPNEDGVVQLDSCVMDGPTHRAGAVAALERVKNPSSVALLVARRTDHALLVGEGALRFARAHGFQEQELLTDEARKIWLDWKETHSDKDDWLHPEADKESSRWRREEGKNWTTGTITCMALTEGGHMAGCTSTSGLSYKLSGRVGDSPIIGAGLYVDNEFGACGSTGRGEANIQNCSSFLVVELMSRGMSPKEACLEVLKRVAKHTEKRLRNKKGEPDYGLTFYALRKDGQFGGAAMRGETKMAVYDGKECTTVGLEGLYKD
ncbi:MAG: N(4)-(beta-N-acetylglucosaminyl)-L-asparaginase [Planctomycetes bacterium]|nr:N(4)-(beta-N-acetylglucosaminyl)-L-asparaginase [Planctomycetota bacterium]